MDWVSDLMLQNPNRWNRDIIYLIFVKEEADQIVSILIPTTNQPNKVVWFKENSGIYSVKSGYKLLLDLSNVNVNEKKLFKQIWSLMCPSKIHILMWKFVKNFIPIYQNLHFRRLITDNKCLRCRLVCESSTHAIQDYLIVAEVWSKLNVQCQIQ
ncbi:hypothetical protein PVK06_009287 [Gossypium arboreum]|uniref:Reverse transcriptase zinc-binding domain-containing protein n=1 Tax=Gossypium arboreum TaxID=29729 RepID=A0ABR0QM84_GOSAR|nr:hypothetical protein PVK06_009287 [Gossypium arboreum]